MHGRSSLMSKSLLASFAFSLFALCAPAQVNTARSLITQPVDESKLTVLHGNTHPLARAEFDRGAAPSSLPMERMLLVLKRSPEQETALETLLAQQQDKSSPNYHKWLTPAAFGAQFGPADQDIQTVSSWLTSHGFQIGNVSNGRTVIEFSGNAGQVQEAFHAPIHNYVVNGEQHWANANDPSIPTALTPAIAGVRSLHNFYPRPMYHLNPMAGRGRPKAAGRANPQFTLPLASGFECNILGTADCYALGPTDFATIYNVLPLWNSGIDGTGETIAVVADSNINTLDVSDFRSSFGLPPKLPTVTVNGTDPGLNGDEIEAILDVEWSGAVAKNATIDLVVSANGASAGVDLSAEDIVDNKLAPILSESFGACELEIGTTANAFYSSLWSQAQGEGITAIISSGDNGSAGCDIEETNPATSPAMLGLAVNGLASTPFNIAVGGTDFNDINNFCLYWNPCNSSTNAANTQASAIGPIPETTWNDSCTNSVFLTGFSGQFVAGQFGATSEQVCNNAEITSESFFGTPLVIPVGGSGGKSACTVSDGSDPSSCTGGNPKPSWQMGVTPNADTTRDLPDVSLFGSDGEISASFYAVCERDQNGSTNDTPCDLAAGEFLGVGGTSASTQVFAGIMALVDQKNESSQGNANMVIYPLFTGPSSASIFNSVTTGTIAMPCSELAGEMNGASCPLDGSTYNVLQTGGVPSYDAGAGYNLATGVGSVNAANFVNAQLNGSPAWTNTTGGADFTLSLNSSSVTVGQGAQSQPVTLTVTAEGGFTGNVTLAVSGLPSETTPNFTTNPVTGGSGATMVTFTTIAPSMLAPIKTPNRVVWPGIGTMIALVSAFCISLLLLGSSIRNRRWTVALALAAFAFVFISAGCGGAGSGGGGGGGNPGTPTGTSSIVITATSGSIQRSVVVNLTVD